jgi:hypothetical protein
MIYEELVLRPSSGVLDRDRITAWLDSRDYAFRDPLRGELWFLTAGKDDVEASRRERLAPTRHFCHEVVVLLLHDGVSVNAHMAGRAEVRALELVRWLVREGEWTVQRDQAPPEPVGDPARLFPADIEVRDHTALEVTEGVRYEWETPGCSFVVHSSGQFRIADDRSAWRGFLTTAGLAAWNEALPPARPDDVVEHASPETATGRFDVETTEGRGTTFFDADDIPDELRRLASLVARWLDELSRSPTSTTFVQRLRDD